MFHRPKSEDSTAPASHSISGTPGQSSGTPEKTESAATPAGASQGSHGAASSPASSHSGMTASSSAPESASSFARPNAAQPVKTEHTTEKETKSMNTPVDKNESPASEGYSRPLDIPGTAAFQRPGVTGPQTPRAPGSAYTPGSYGAASTTTYGSSSSTNPAASSSRRLVVGEGINMSGEIDSCDTLIVEGTVEAALKGASILDIAETGMFYGTVEIDECTIAGRFEGDITVHGRLTVKASGSITGSIAYKELAVEAGATVDGKMSPLNASGKKAEKKDMKPGKKLGGAQGSELPFAGHVSAAE